MSRRRELDEFAAAVPVFDEGVNLTSEQIDAGQQADGAVALVFVIACEGRMQAGYGRQVWGRSRDRLDPRLLIATASLGACLAAAAASLISFTSR
jgi:hypothetical protein